MVSAFYFNFTNYYLYPIYTDFNLSLYDSTPMIRVVIAIVNYSSYTVERKYFIYSNHHEYLVFIENLWYLDCFITASKIAICFLYFNLLIPLITIFLIFPLFPLITSTSIAVFFLLSFHIIVITIVYLYPILKI